MMLTHNEVIAAVNADEISEILFIVNNSDYTIYDKHEDGVGIIAEELYEYTTADWLARQIIINRLERYRNKNSLHHLAALQ